MGQRLSAPRQRPKPAWPPGKSNVDPSYMMIDDDTLKQLLRMGRKPRVHYAVRISCISRAIDEKGGAIPRTVDSN